MYAYILLYMLCINNFKKSWAWAGQTAQWIKRLLHKGEDLSLSPAPCQSQAWWSMFTTPSAGLEGIQKTKEIPGIFLFLSSISLRQGRIADVCHRIPLYEDSGVLNSGAHT